MNLPGNAPPRPNASFPGLGITVALLSAAGLMAGGAVLGERWFEDVTSRAGVSAKHTNRSFKNPYAHIKIGRAHV